MFILRYHTKKIRTKMLRLFSTKNNTIKNWRSRAWSIDPQKTRLIITTTEQSLRQVSPRIHRKTGNLELISC